MRQRLATSLNRINPYVRFFVFLLVMAAGFFAWMSVMGCIECAEERSYFSSQVAQKTDAPAPKVRGKLVGYGTDITGNQIVRRTIRAEENGATGEEKITFAWTPPDGASNFSWTMGQPPDNPTGPPPFVWTNANPDLAIEFEYQTPSVPQGVNSVSVSETLSTQCDGSNPTLEQLNTVLHGGSTLQAETGMPKDYTQSVERMPVDSTTDDIEVWQTMTWYDPKGMELTTETCQGWVDVLSSDEFFFAVQMPVTSSGPITESQSLSLVMGEQNPGLFVIMTAGWLGEVYRSDVETRNERATFMTNALPEEAGKAWVALGLPDDAPDCDDDLSWPADQWSFITSLTLDLRALPNEGLGTYLTNYMCYEGESLPWVDMLAQSLARRAGLEVASYQDDDIICMGAAVVPLADRYGLGVARHVFPVDCRDGNAVVAAWRDEFW